MQPDIYGYIQTEENRYETEERQIGDNWFWNMRRHVQLIFHLVNGVFYTGENNWLRMFKQIMRPMLRLSFWTEDLEVKDTTFWIEGKDDKVLSFVVKKYHDEVYTRENDLDKMFDEITESDITYGGSLVQKGKDRPEGVPLNAIAFANQSNLLGSAVGIKVVYSPADLREMSKLGWGDEKNGADISIEELCTLASAEETSIGTQSDQKFKVPSKSIEVYIIKGSLPEHYLKDNNEMDYHCDQVQIRAFYTKKGGKYNGKEGVCLYRKKAAESTLKFHSSEPVYGKALGYSDGEALLHPQIWSNFLSIHKMSMLEAGSKVPLVTDDPTFTQKNKIQDMETLEITTIEEGKSINRIETAAVANIQLFENEINALYELAQENATAQDPLMGKEASSGTTFRGQERSVAQGRGWHDRRRGQRAKFIEEIYRDWIIPDMVKGITNGKKFLATLSTQELMWVADQLAVKEANNRIKEKMFKGEVVTPEAQALLTQTIKTDFLKRGNKQLVEVLKGELDGIELRMGINIAGKQKNLANLSDKVLSILEVAMVNPQFKANLEANGMIDSFNDLLEYSGLNPVAFSNVIQAQANPQAVLSPMQDVQPKPELALTAQ